MKTPFFLKLLTLAILIIQLSCNKAENSPGLPKSKPPLTFDNMLGCYNMTAWDSSAIQTKLIGKWKWEYIQCYWNPEDANNEDFKDLQVEFKLDNTLEVKENGQATKTSAWKVADLNDGFFKIVVTPIVPQLPGRILFCDSLVLFYDSYVDGCDNYFKKTN